MTRLCKYVQDFVELMAWSEEVEVEVDEAHGTSRLGALINVDGQPCRLLVSAHEDSKAISVLLYPPFHVKEAKLAQACTLVNAINHATLHGRLELDPADGELRYRNSADAAFAEPSANLIRRMVDFAAGSLGYWMWALAEVGITDRTAKEILAEEDRRRAQTAEAGEPAVDPPRGGGRSVTLH